MNRVTCVLFTVANVGSAAGKPAQMGHMSRERTNTVASTLSVLESFQSLLQPEKCIYTQSGRCHLQFIIFVLMFEACLIRAQFVLDVSSTDLTVLSAV